MAIIRVLDNEIEDLQGQFEACQGLKDFQAEVIEEWANEVIRRALNEVTKTHRAQQDKLRGHFGDSLRERRALMEQLADARLKLEQRPVVRWVPTLQQLNAIDDTLSVWQDDTTDPRTRGEVVGKWIQDCQSALFVSIGETGVNATNSATFTISVDGDDFQVVTDEFRRRESSYTDGRRGKNGMVLAQIIRDLHAARQQPATAEAGSVEEVPLPEGCEPIPGFDRLCEQDGKTLTREKGMNGCPRYIAIDADEFVARLRRRQFAEETVRQVCKYMIRSLAIAAGFCVTFTPTP